MDHFEQARALLNEFKSGRYLQGPGVLSGVGELVARRGRTAALVRSGFSAIEPALDQVKDSLDEAGVEIVAEIRGARPNAPLEDLARITEELEAVDYEVLISFGGGSVIDCAKAADVLVRLGGKIEDYFGVGLVTKSLDGRALTPHVAIQTAASSAAHLTKYSNITDMATGQKKLIVDEAIVPTDPVFDYELTKSSSYALTSDGALDGAAHMLEVFFGANGQAHFEKMVEVVAAGLPLIVEHLPTLQDNPDDSTAREALGLASDLGGYAIMLGGTNGAHLTSFSLVDILSHGRACALMQPYYTVFFSPEISAQLKQVGEVFVRFGHAPEEVLGLHGRALGEAVAKAMMAFARSIGFPLMLAEVSGFTPEHLERALTAAKNPQLKMKLENMPVPLTAEMVDYYMGPVLNAAVTGDLELIRTVE